MVASRGRSFTYLYARSTLSNRSNLLLVGIFSSGRDGRELIKEKKGGEYCEVQIWVGG